MNILLDENIPHNLRSRLPGHEVATVTYCGWGGLKNGELLAAAEDMGFEIFVTADRELEYQQNIPPRRLAVVALSAHHWPIIKYHVREILEAISRASQGQLVHVNCGSFVRHKRRAL